MDDQLDFQEEQEIDSDQEDLIFQNVLAEQKDP